MMTTKPQKRDVNHSRTDLQFLSVVCGGAGFLGSHLCDRLMAERHEVVCLDNLSTGRRENIRHLRGNARFTDVEHDIVRPAELSLLLGGPGSRLADFLGAGNCKLLIWHLASPASPRDYQARPVQTLQAGSLGTEHALEWAREHGGTFLLASTSEVYGDPKVNPQPESYWGNVNPIGPRSVYDEAKRYAEALTMAYHRAYAAPVRIARIFNTFGERMRIDDGRVLPNFMMQALQNKSLTIYGDGSQTRSFCYVGDLVEGLVLLMFSEETEPVNLGNPDEVTVLRLAEEVIRVTGSSSSITFEPLPVDDPRRRQPDISRAENVLNWRPRVSRGEGLKRMTRHFRSEVEALCAR